MTGQHAHREPLTSTSEEATRPFSRKGRKGRKKKDQKMSWKSQPERMSHVKRANWRARGERGGDGMKTERWSTAGG